MRTGIFRVMAVQAVGMDLQTARTHARFSAGAAAKGARRAKLMIREEARREADAFIVDISEEARLADARAEYDDIVEEIEDCPAMGRITNPRRDFIQHNLACMARQAEVPAWEYEKDKDRLFGKKCDICGDRGCTIPYDRHDADFYYR